MPTYILMYFDLRGHAEPARQLFLLAGVPFKDKRFGYGDDSFESVKNQMPFGQLPVLMVDSLLIPQSAAIWRYLARKFGYAGTTPEEEAMVDAVVDQHKDFATTLRPLFMARNSGRASEVARVTNELFLPARDVYFEILNGLLRKSKSGWLVGKGLTLADLVVADNLVTLEKLGHFDKKKEKRLAALRKKVHKQAKLKEYIRTRKDTEF